MSSSEVEIHINHTAISVSSIGLPGPQGDPGPQGGARVQGLGRLLDKLASLNHSGSRDVGVLGLGSSVGVGATISPSDAPSAYLSQQVEALLNQSGTGIVTHYNASENGSIVAQGGDRLTLGQSALPSTDLVLLSFGMNDGSPFQFHSGQTFQGLLDQTTALCRRIIRDGATPIIATTPHPHRGRYVFGNGPQNPTYAHSSGVPIPGYSEEDSIVSITHQGRTLPVFYRYLRVNSALRLVARRVGAAIIDAERNWFDALLSVDEDDLFNQGEIVHPNTLGHQLSYHKAIDEFIENQAFATSAPGRDLQLNPASFLEERFTNVPSGHVLDIPIKPRSCAQLHVWIEHGGGWHSAYCGLVRSSNTSAAITALGEVHNSNPANAFESVVGGSSNGVPNIRVTGRHTISAGRWEYALQYYGSS